MSEPAAVIRPDANGTVAHVFISHVSVRMEAGAFDEVGDEWTIRMEREDGTHVLLVLDSEQPIRCIVVEDEIGCIDDRPSHAPTEHKHDAEH